MATARTKSDALGYYASDPAGLGGVRADRELNTLDFLVSDPIPAIIIQRISPSTAAGTATIRATSTTQLAYTAPGDTEGTAVTVPSDTSVLLESGTPGYSIRVYRDSGYSADVLGGSMSLDIVPGFNNAIGLSNITTAGATTYGMLWLHNHSDADITSITITPIAGYSVALETPASGAVQTIADDTTAPTGVTWESSETIATLAAGESQALWLRRVVGATTVDVDVTATVTIGYVYGGVTYTDANAGRYRIGNAALALYELYIGEGTQPDFTASPAATSATLPFSEALTADATSNYAVRLRNQYDLVGLNVLTQQRVIDADGVDITNALTDPTVVSTESMAGGEVDVVLYYGGGSLDAIPATQWRLYITSDGTAPDTGADTPVDYDMTVQGLGLPNPTQRITLGPYAYGTALKFIARTYQPDEPLESASTTVTSHTVTSQKPIMPNWFSMATGAARGYGPGVYDSETAYGDAAVRILAGEVILSGASEAFRAVLGNGQKFKTGLEFHNVAHSASGTSAAIEAVSANEIYINVAGTRRAKIDLSNGRIEAALFSFTTVALDIPVIGPTYTTTTETYLMVFNGITGRWTPAVKVDSDGRFTTTAEVLQEIA